VSATTLLAGSDHERVLVVQDARSGLRAVIAVHSTALGPAVGGLRMMPYPDLDAAVFDALRLSAAMSLKNAAAGLGLGGGKAVIVSGPADDGDTRRARLIAFAGALESLGGSYFTAEDVGTSPQDMELLATRTRYVLGLPPERGGTGDPSPVTARTVLGAIRDGVRVRLGRDSLAGLRIGVVGVGKVGGALAEALAAEGAELVLADQSHARAGELAQRLDAQVSTPDALLRERLDVLAPCATGEMIDAALASELSCAVIAGAANNPLVDDAAAEALHARGILYVPDFLANCGGMLNVAAEYRRAGDGFVEAGVVAARERLRAVLDAAASSGRMPLDVAREQALSAIAAARADGDGDGDGDGIDAAGSPRI
jgi:leucine dehydrogenase